ncbi:MAG TPA: DUF2804 domain-containing protein [Bacillota bacterium]|nr:DUF2804 domain-containing protein [Bacillota bacterium]HPF42275.1 DUF2804 domain-containing protein [Bacillota bacterium]HPJ86109.1 DUF2804 domain-containing protein [Bacillota bacterium]HPQ61958.1 DUF2804 domain-containing protein [Bacillota bacterium]
MQYRITEKGNLLNEKGRLATSGYATSLLLHYDRNEIAASPWRIKEWDYYAVLTAKYGVAFVVSDLGYTAMVSAVFFDFVKKTQKSMTKLFWFTFGKMGLPSSSEKGNVSCHQQGYDFDFIRNQDERLIKVTIKDFYPGKDLRADLTLKDMKDETMVIATPWQEKPKAFYYNQKINCIPAYGSVLIGEESYAFKEGEAYGVLDWGRGVWTYKNTWYWSNLSGIVDGHRVGFNIGYGFGDTSKATENMLFYDGVSHKLDQVTFEIQEPDFLKPWKFTDNEGRLSLTMEPLVDRQDHTNMIIIKNMGHQVFGKFTGFIVLDDGKRIELKDMIGFAEKITNHY